MRFYDLRRTAVATLPTSVRTNLRQIMGPLIRSWINSPLAQYLDHRHTDVYLISFPRSGRTWLRTMIGTAICQNFGLNVQTPELIADLWKYDPKIPSIRLDHGAIRLNNPAKFKQKKVILLVRNPLDIGVSSYHFKKGNDMVEYVSSEVKQVIKCYNAWAEFMADHPSCLIIKYEDLLEDPEYSLQQIFQFIDLPEVCHNETLKQVIEQCSFNNLKKLANDPSRTLFYRPNASEMVRSGKSGSSKLELAQSTYEELKQLVLHTLNKDFNYFLNSY